MAKKKVEDVIHVCRECAHVTEVTRFETLSVHERRPTLGTCPYWTQSRSVLLSQKSCRHFKNKPKNIIIMAEKKDPKQDNMRFYEILRQVPKEALKTIQAGRLKGFSDINPLFRIKAMTQTFGPCGIGWKYEITKQWQETYGQEVKSFTNINLYIKVDGEWSEPIPGTGGATIVEINSKGYAYVNDEGPKMSLTDALSVAMKSLGVAADVYYSKDANYDTKYEQQAYMAQSTQPTKPVAASAPQPSNLQQALKEIAACADTKALIAVWNKYPSLTKDANFTGAMTARKDQILKNGKK